MPQPLNVLGINGQIRFIFYNLLRINPVTSLTLRMLVHLFFYSKSPSKLRTQRFLHYAL